MDIGVFYIGQPIPEYNPGRIKFGFTDNIHRRRREHSALNPHFSVLKTYPCKRQWEQPIIGMLQKYFSFIGPELLETTDPELIEIIMQKCDEIFDSIES